MVSLNWQSLIITPIILAIITLVFNIALHKVRNQFDFIMDTNKFKREHYYNQLSELYMELYAIVAQSEFLKVFHDLKEIKSLRELPFIEIEEKLKSSKKDLFTGKITHQEETGVKTAISQFNKMKIIELVMENKKYASQELLKLAVGYRYCHKLFTK